MIKLRLWNPEKKNEFEVDITVNHPNGRSLRKRVKAPVTGKSNAERWAKALEQEMLTQLLSPEPEPDKPLAPTFEAFTVMFFELCRANRLGRNTLSGYDVCIRRYLMPVLGKRRLDAITPSDLTALKASMMDKAHNTMCEVLRVLRRMFNVALEQRVIDRIPANLEVPRRQRKAVIAYDPAEQDALLKAAKALGPHYEVMVLLGMDAGLRRNEILALHWTDIDLTRGRLVVRNNIVRGELDQPKGRTEDEISLTKRLRDALRGYQHPGRFVFTNAQGSHYCETEVQKWLRKVVNLANVPWHGTHILRKTCGTRIADGGGGVAAVADHLRHKDLQTASRYIDRRGASNRALAALER